MPEFRARALYVEELQPGKPTKQRKLPPSLTVVRPDGSLEPERATLKDGFYEFDIENETLAELLRQDLAEPDIEWSYSDPSEAYKDQNPVQVPSEFVH